MPAVYSYKSRTSAHTYLLNTTTATFTQGQDWCTRQGGSMVSYQSAFEQAEVEGYFVEQGMLLPTYHKRYWIGLAIPYKDPRLWPQFQWTE